MVDGRASPHWITALNLTKLGAMNTYSRYVTEQMAARGWSNAECARRSGLSRQVIGSIVNDKRTSLTDIPHRETTEKLARAFGVKHEEVLAQVAIAMGLPVTVTASGVSGATNDELLAEIGRRMREGESHDRQGEAEPRTEAGGQEHSGTGRGKDGGEAGQSGAAIGEVHELHPDQGQIQPTPSAEKSVALRTENRGKAKKREQDRHAED